MMRPTLESFMAVAVIAMVAIMPACNNDDDRDASGRPNTTTATSTAGGASATTIPAGTATSDPTGDDAASETPTTTRALDVWTAPGEPSPLELGTGLAEPEYPAGANGTVADLADGKLDLLVVQVDAGSRQILVNVVVLMVGDGAKAEATADGILRPGEELTGNYYVRDRNPKLRGVGVDDDIELTGEKGAAVEPAKGIAKVSAALIDRLTTAPVIPYRATVSGGKVTRLVVPAVDDPTIGR